MLSKLAGIGVLVALSVAVGRPVMAQPGGGVEQPVKPSGPAATKAADLMQRYTGRIEKEIEQGRKEAERLCAELHELIDVRNDMANAIAELRGDLAAKGTYSADAGALEQAPAQEKRTAPPQAQGRRAAFHRDLFYGLGSALPTDPTPQQREQLRRLAPRSDLKLMIERLRAEVEETRAEVDQLAYKLLELSEGITAPRRGFGGMGGMMGGGNGVPWFGSIGVPQVGGMM